jgi:ribonuclease III
MTFDELQKSLSIEFHDQALLRLAFVHRSYLNEDKATKESNERLEFLGDAILSFLTSKFLYSTYPEYPEGTLTNIRSGLVKTKTLGEVASKLSFGEVLLLSHGEIESGGRHNQSLLADSFEAFLGALFLDSGIDICRTFLETHLFPITKTIIETKSYIDYKSRLQEIVQEHSRESPVYKVIKSEGPDHNKTFWVEVYSEKNSLGQGEGKSKQAAEQAAASDALEKLGKK